MMEGLPDGWKKYKIKDIGSVVTGNTPPKNNPKNYGGNLPWIKPPDLDNEMFVSNSDEKISEIGRKKVRLLPKGSVLVSCIGNIGKVAIAECDLCTNQQINSIIPKMEVVDSIFLYYQIKKIKPNLENVASSFVVPLLNKKAFSNIEIPLPPLPTQKKIADILEKAEKLKTWRAEADKLTDEFLKSTFMEMFGDPVKNPMGWGVSNLGNELTDDTQNGLYKPEIDYGNGVPILRIDSFYDGQISDIEKLKRLKCTKEEIEKFKLQIGDILINRVNSLEYLGKCGLVKFLIEDTVYESNMMRIRPKPEKLNPTFLTMFLCTQYIKNQILGCAKKAVNQASINQKDVNSFKILLPPLPLQQKFAAIVQQVEQMRQYQQESKAHIDDLFNALMQKAFKGELVA